MNTFVLAPLLWSLCSAAVCDDHSQVLCHDETSLVQVKQTVQLGSKQYPVEEKALAPALVELSAVNHQEKEERPSHKIFGLFHKKKHRSTGLQSLPPIVVGGGPQQQQGGVQLGSASATAQQQQLPYYSATAQQQQLPYYSAQAAMPFAGAMAGYTPGLVPNPTDYHVNQVSVQSIVSPGNEDPRKAAATAAHMEELAERAMEDAVWKAQQEERASMRAAKKGMAFRAAAQKASAAENTAARSQIAAADAFENSAVRRAATDRTHARVAAYKAVVQQATSYQAAADQTFAAQRAAAARTAAQAAKDGLHNMQDDTAASDYQFNDRDANRGARHQYHKAMDEIQYDRSSFRGGDEDQDYDTDESGGSSGGHVAAATAAAAAAVGGGCNVGDVVSATFAGDGRQYNAKVSAINGDSVTVTWLDGYTEGTTVSAAQAWKGGTPCAGVPAAVA